MREIFESPEYWAKLAVVQPLDTPITTEDQEAMLHGFLDFMKEAGADPLAVHGFLRGIAEEFEPEFAKQADVAPPVVPLAQQLGQKLLTPAAATGANPYTSRPWFDPVNLAHKAWGWLPEGAKQVGRDFAHGGALAVADHTAQTQHPGMYGVLKGLYNGDQNQADETLLALGQHRYGDALSQGWKGLQNNSYVTKYAPYVVPGLATMAAGKLMGMSTPMAMGAGLMGGAGGGYLYNHPEIFKPTAVPGDKQPPPDPHVPAANTEKVNTPSDSTTAGNSQNAQKILQGSLSLPGGISMKSPDEMEAQ